MSELRITAEEIAAELAKFGANDDLGFRKSTERSKRNQSIVLEGIRQGNGIMTIARNTGISRSACQRALAQLRNDGKIRVCNSKKSWMGHEVV